MRSLVEEQRWRARVTRRAEKSRVRMAARNEMTLAERRRRGLIEPAARDAGAS